MNPFFKFLYQAEPPTGPGGGSGTPAGENPAGAASPPAAPAPEPAKPAEPQGADTISLDEKIQINLPDGGTKLVSYRELQDAYTTRPTEEVQQQNDLLRKAFFENDPQAAKQVIDLVGGPTEPEGPPPDENIASLQAEMKALKEAISTMAGPVRTYQQSQELLQLKGIIEANAEKFPLVSRHPEGALTVQRQVQHYRDLARREYNVKGELPPETMRRVLVQSLSDAEESIKANAAVFGIDVDDFLKQVQGNAGQPAAGTNVPPEAAGPTEETYRPPRWDMNKPAHPQQGVIPNKPVPLPQGTPPGPGTQPGTRPERMTEGNFLDRIRQRMQRTAQGS